MGRFHFLLTSTLAVLVLLTPSALGATAAIFSVDNGTIDVHEFGLPNKERVELDVAELLDKEDLAVLATVRARFFPDEPEVAFLRKKASLTSWYGELEDGIGTVNFNIVGGRLTGSAVFNDTVYHIFLKPSLDGEPKAKASRLALAEFPAESEERCFGECFDDSDEIDAPSYDTATNGDVETIDAMIVYTYRAMCAEAGLEEGCEITPENKAAIEDRARLAVEETNNAYELSGVKGRQSLVHIAMVDETYDDSTASFDTMLNDLSLTDDGKLDEVHEWRQTYGADLVSMFVENPASCGLAWLYDRTPEAAFSVVYRDCSTGYYSYAHETAHNMGAHHDETNSQGTSGIFSFGFQDPKERFRTILAYDCDTKSCLRIQRFSSPNITFQNEALGGATADNVKKINFRWDEVAAYVEKVDTSQPTSTSASPSTFFASMILVLATTTFAIWIPSL